MSDSTTFRDQGVRRVLMVQLLLMAVVAGGFGFSRGLSSAFAGAYGAAVTLAMTWWMARRVDRASTLAARDLAQGSLVLFGGLAQKYLFAMVALAVGFALKLDALALLAGFGLTHLAFLFGGTGHHGRMREIHHHDPKGS